MRWIYVAIMLVKRCPQHGIGAIGHLGKLIPGFCHRDHAQTQATIQGFGNGPCRLQLRSP